MTILLLERLRQFHAQIVELSLARYTIALPAPEVLALSAPTANIANTIFSNAITEQEIVAVCRDLFASGHYSIAVAESFKAMEKFVQKKVKEKGLSGAKLMQKIFSIDAPLLFWSERSNTSEEDEQKGYLMLYAGAMIGVRNPVTHEFNWIDDEHIALELILFAQHLLKKAKHARLL